MHTKILPAALAASLLATTALPAAAAQVFNRIASFPVATNSPDAETSSAEIITASEDGMLLVYSDSPAGGIGFIDITDPRAPKAAGFLAFDGEPTSVTIVGGKAFVAVNTRESFANPSGVLAVVDLASKTVDKTCDLGGQPDSTAHDRAGTLLAIAIENERDEDVNDGAIPQMPAGYLTVFDIAGGTVDCGAMRKVELTGLADIAPEDPEAEFVDINEMGEVAVTLQENNHIVIVDGKTGTVTADFSAGAVDVAGVDTKRDGVLSFTGSQEGRLREPDSVRWLDNERLVVANEGDLDGGSRGFTIFSKDGTVLYENGAAMELEAARMGHYPDARSSKGVEPEGLEVATFGDTRYIFVTQERSSLIGVFKDTGADPEYLQALPSGISPEGLVAIPSRNLLATANEVDLRGDGLGGAHVMVYQLSEGEAAYPQLISDLDADGRPIGWVAISGAVADADKPGILYAVSDSVLNEATIYTIDATAKPARITGKLVITRSGNPAQKLDLEGVTLDGNGGYWVASEGRSDRLYPHALFRVDKDGKIAEEVAFPEALLPSEIRFGAEGIAAVGEGDAMTLWIAIQREWKDDPKGMVKLLSYNPKSKEWGAVHYPLETPAEGTWVGLSEITVHGDYAYIVERDNQVAGKAVVKSIYRVPVSALVPGKLGETLPVVAKELVRDLIPDLQSLNGYVLDKVESLAIDSAGTGFVITDNDGVADSSGETMFRSIGAVN